MVGVGYRAAVSGSNLTLSLGYSHPIEMAVPKGLAVSQPHGWVGRGASQPGGRKQPRSREGTLTSTHMPAGQPPQQRLQPSRHALCCHGSIQQPRQHALPVSCRRASLCPAVPLP